VEGGPWWLYRTEEGVVELQSWLAAWPQEQHGRCLYGGPVRLLKPCLLWYGMKPWMDCAREHPDCEANTGCRCCEETTDLRSGITGRRGRTRMSVGLEGRSPYLVRIQGGSLLAAVVSSWERAICKRLKVQTFYLHG
jgi:hypothetical protein